MKLYVIGNGFDLSHNLKSSYNNYREFVKKYANEANGWGSILEYYPEEHEFWSDAETYICKIDRNRFLSLKRLFGITDLDLLLPKIRKSFEAFITSVEGDVLNLQPKFSLEKDALYITFNYTSVLETVYGIPPHQIIHLHNTAGDAAMHSLFQLDANEIVLGHGPHPEHFFSYTDQDIGNDKDYIAFKNKTLKNTTEITKMYRLDEILVNIQSQVTEVAFYGFSFSPNDQDYVRLIAKNLRSQHTRFKLYYFVEKGETDEMVIDRFQDKIMKCAFDVNRLILVKCNDINRF